MPRFSTPAAPHVLAAAFCAGLGAALAARAPASWPALLAVALALGSLVVERRRLVALGVALLLAGWWWGSVRLDGLDRSALSARIGEAGLARLVVTGPARRTEFAVRLPVEVLRFDRIEPDEPARLDLPPGRVPLQGSILAAVVEIERPRAPEAPGSFDEAGYLRRQGVQVVLEAERYRVVGRRSGLGGLADRIRGRLAGSLAPGLEGERRALVAAVVLGEDERLDEELRQDFRASGLYHLLAVSGQNVAYVVAGAILLAWGLGLPRWAGEIGALAGVLGYVLAVGWQPSVVRAGVAGALASLAWLASRPRDRWYFLLLGAAVLLAWNPYSLLEPGFQLSFGAVAAIFLIVPPLERRLEGYPLPRRLAEVCALSAGCGAATAPILMAHFGAVPVYTIPANAAAAPVMAPLLGCGLIAAALHPLLPSAALALAWVNGWLAAYLGACATFFGRLPHAQLTAWRMLALLVGATGILILLARLPPPRGRRAVIVGLAALLVVVGWTIRPGPAPPPPDGLRITFLDVGQGDAALLEVPQGAVLIDQGPPEADVAGQVRRLGVRRLAAIVLTHPQRDHVGGAADVLDRLPVGFVLDPRLPARSADEQAALAEAREEQVPVVTARAGAIYRIGRLRLRVLWPDGPGTASEDPNDHAVVILASYGHVDALFTADAEGNVLAPLRPPPVEILKVSHHGSADEYLGGVLEFLRPKIAVISVGRGNDYGHPVASTVARLAQSPDLRLYRTDEDGRVVITSDRDALSVATER